MKLNSFLLVGIMAASLTASAQIGKDWTAISGQSWTSTEKDGKTHTRTMYYSPSTVRRSGDVVSLTLDTVFTDGTSTRFYEVQLNCQSRQYTFAQYDVSVNPAILGQRSDWKSPEPNSPFPVVYDIVCKTL